MKSHCNGGCCNRSIANRIILEQKVFLELYVVSGYIDLVILEAHCELVLMALSLDWNTAVYTEDFIFHKNTDYATFTLSFIDRKQPELT
jgi:hypothetical protein